MAVHYFQRFDLFPVAKFPTSGFWDRAKSDSSGTGLQGISTSATVSDVNRILWLGAMHQDVDIAVKYRPLSSSILNSGNATTDAGLQIYARCTTEFTDPTAGGSSGLNCPLSNSVQSSSRVRQRLTGTLTTLLNASTTGNMSDADMNGPFTKWFRVRLNSNNFQRASWHASGSPSALSTAATFSQNAALNAATYVGVSWAAQGVVGIAEVSIGTNGDDPVFTPPSNTHKIEGILRNPSAALVGVDYPVDVYHQPTNKLFGTALTDSSGFWQITIPEQFSTDEFFTIGRDPAATWNSPIVDRIIPQVI